MGQVVSDEVSHAMRNDDVGSCVWYGICDRIDNGGIKIKNCAYEGNAKVLNASGVEALNEWCSHLIPNDYVKGDNVYTCCDNEQVSKNIIDEIS